ncbi:MAG: LacI family DNA-binding transcriptional regulator [Pseudomonadota bacterium]
MGDTPPNKVRRRGPAAGPTAADVAELASVSRATVSRSFDPSSPVDAETRARILQAARELGYRVGDAVSAMHSPADRGAKTVGLVMGDLDNPFYHTVLTLFLDQLHDRGLRALCRSSANLFSSDEHVRQLLRSGVDALIIASSGLHSSAIAACSAASVPVILFNRDVQGAAATSVQTDNYGGGQILADVLAQAGHSRIAFVNGLEGSSTNSERRQGFSDRLAEHGIAPPRQEFSEYTYHGGREAAGRLMASGGRPDAIFAANDISALGVMDGLRFDLGLSIPGDVSVVGFDDIPMASWPSFHLTTVRQRRNQMVRESIALLDRYLDDAAAPPRTIKVAGRLIVRSSARLATAQAA